MSFERTAKHVDDAKVMTFLDHGDMCQNFCTYLSWCGGGKSIRVESIFLDLGNLRNMIICLEVFFEKKKIFEITISFHF